jgi:hypothetical protein
MDAAVMGTLMAAMVAAAKASAAYDVWDVPAAALRFISIWPRRIEHHSLWSAIGIPHSTHTRTRGFGGSFLPNKRFNSDMPGS